MNNTPFLETEDMQELGAGFDEENLEEQDIGVIVEQDAEEEIFLEEENTQEGLIEVSLENNQEEKIDLSSEIFSSADHSKLENLDYKNSGHTGFQPAGDYALRDDIPTKTSELENDSNYITDDIETDFNIDGKLYLNTVKSGVSDTAASRIVFGTADKIYSYLSSNTSGAFAFSKGKGNITIYPNTGTYNCLMTDCNSDLGRSDRKWKDLYLSGDLKDGTNTIPISKIATTEYVEKIVGDIEALLSEV